MPDFILPETRYALSGDVNIAYQVMGAGPVDVIMVPGVVSHVEFLHEVPGYTAFLRLLSASAASRFTRPHELWRSPARTRCWYRESSPILSRARV